MGIYKFAVAIRDSVAWGCRVSTLDLRMTGRGFDSRPLSGNNLRQVVHTRVPVIKQVNLVPVNGRRCPAAGKITIGLALHWPVAMRHTFTNGLMA